LTNIYKYFGEVSYHSSFIMTTNLSDVGNSFVYGFTIII